MQNKERGTASIEIDGSTYRMSMPIDSIVQLEEVLATPLDRPSFPVIVGRLLAGGIREFRAFMWAALREHHPELTLKRVGEMIQAAGGTEKFAEQVSILSGSTIPDPKDLEALGAKPSRNPRKRT